MGLVAEFREFAVKGNVVDMAVGIIIGAGFGKIVTSMVNDIITPIVGVALGKTDFSEFFINLSGTPYATLADAKAAGAPTVNYGLFINSVIDFSIMAFVIFIMIRYMNKLRRKEEAAAESK